MHLDIEDLKERAADWELAAVDPDVDAEQRAQYAELAALDRAEIARIESVSW